MLFSCVFKVFEIRKLTHVNCIHINLHLFECNTKMQNDNAKL